MKYYTADEHPPRGFTNPGNPIQKEYKLDPDRNEVVVAGETNLQDLIDSAENSARLDKVLERYQIDEDLCYFPQYRGVIDMTRAPRDLSGAFELVDSARSVYNSLSTDQQNKFGSFAAFCSAIDRGDVSFDAPPAPVKKPDQPVKEASLDGKQ